MKSQVLQLRDVIFLARLQGYLTLIALGSGRVNIIFIFHLELVLESARH